MIEWQNLQSVPNVQPLENVLNAAAWIILYKQKFDHITTDVQDRLHWLPVQQHIKYKVCVLVYKCLHQAAPTYLAELCSTVSELASRGYLHSAVFGWPGSTKLQNNEIWPKMFRCFRTSLVELTPFDNSWPITNTNSVLWAFENCYSVGHTKH